MSDTKELTYSDVAEHNTKKDLYVVVHDKVYNASSFVDEHPGGEEVMLDVGGQDATEAFEDVGHSDEAREILNGMLVGNLKRQEGDPAPKTHASAPTPASSSSPGSGPGANSIIFLIVGAALAYFGYTFMQTQQSSQGQK
ncbi:cytochrome b5-like protein 1 [Elsinoe australis]|uniref:Cytochrome b5-like protein 1 n=1 Tax=Elsinoe australis TaxID=40998 RepID=A0A2P8A2R2_9PEZI|nr:hypothetical protein B9Z65_3814 [Elsinoe australis]TKX24831.1 cytochrome b5-like protein 1 [Elsinoe australis]